MIRDVYFNKECTVNGKLKTLRENIKIMEPGLLQEVLKKAAKGDIEINLPKLFKCLIIRKVII